MLATKLLQRIDKFLNGLTMYRLVLYGLSVIAIAAIALAFTGALVMSGIQLLITFATLLVVCYVTNLLLGRFWPALTNTESFLITALILGFILPPADSVSHWVAIVLAGVLAMASKYLLAPYRKHIFNPAAFAAVVLGLANLLPASWWIGSPVLLPFTAIFGLLLLRKLHRFKLFGSFLIASLAVTSLVSLHQHVGLAHALAQAFTSSPLIFLGTVMLTEPLTMPPRLPQQLIYGGMVGAIFSAQLHAGRVSSTPELALVLGNLFSFVVSPKYKLQLRLKQKTQLSSHVYDFAFVPDRAFNFRPGQYLEWTLPVKPRDSRGNRRTFSIASSPGEKEVHIAIKTTDKPQGFKRALLAMQPGDPIMAGQLGGDFTLPADPQTKLVFVAGGIGITPFRSMLQHLVDSGERRDIVLFYMVSDPQEVSFSEVFNGASTHGLKVIPVLSVPRDTKPPTDWQHPTGYLTSELLTQYVPDFTERTFYLSGPNAMVTSYTHLLRSQGINRRSIVTDYFSGY